MVKKIKIFEENNRNHQYVKGAITIEASIVIPFFIFVALSFAFFIKVIYTHEIIQHALNQTANEISQFCYVYQVSGIKGIEKEILKSIDDKIEESEFIPKELQSLLTAVVEGAYDEGFNKLCQALSKIYMGKYFIDEVIKNPRQRLEGLNIVEGMKGLDISMSSFLEDDCNDIDIIVVYRIKIPIPINLFPPICIIQRAVIKAWLFGDECEELIDRYEEDVWSLDNLDRGKKIRELFGANLPFNFPVIAIYNKGSVSMIKSMDITAQSYQKTENIIKKIELYINELAKYDGQENPWGKEGIIIKGEDIKCKLLLLVIPKNPIEEDISNALEDCKTYAKGKGIILDIKKYGYKKNEYNNSE